MRFRAAVPALALLLAGCAADVTFQLDVRPNGSALATTREVLDDDLYRMASRQTAMPDPFGIQTMQREGWSVATATDANGNHVIKMFIKDAVNEGLHGGAFDKAMAKNYGMGRQGNPR